MTDPAVGGMPGVVHSGCGQSVRCFVDTAPEASAGKGSRRMAKFSPAFFRLFTAPVDKRLSEFVDKRPRCCERAVSALFGEIFATRVMAGRACSSGRCRR